MDKIDINSVASRWHEVVSRFSAFSISQKNMPFLRRYQNAYSFYITCHEELEENTEFQVFAILRNFAKNSLRTLLPGVDVSYPGGFPFRFSIHSLSSLLTRSKRSRSLRASSSRLAFNFASSRPALINSRGIVKIYIMERKRHRRAVKMCPSGYSNHLTNRVIPAAAVTAPIDRKMRTFVFVCTAAAPSLLYQDQEHLTTHFTTMTSYCNRRKR